MRLKLADSLQQSAAAPQETGNELVRSMHQVCQGAGCNRAAADAWSLGTCLHTLLMGMPFAAAMRLGRSSSSSLSSSGSVNVTQGSQEPQPDFRQHVSCCSTC